MDSIETDSDIACKSENFGWADAMSHILKTRYGKKNKKTIVLSKAKKLVPMKTEPGEAVEAGKKQSTERRIRKQDWVSKGRMKPNVLEKDRERRLSKIAVRGVVQLFNTVQQQQKKLNSDPSRKTSEVNHPEEKTAITKTMFLDILKNGPKSMKIKSEDDKSEEECEVKDFEDEKPQSWNVLRDNFIDNSKYKNWDQIES